jgi:hypothetical protein
LRGNDEEAIRDSTAAVGSRGDMRVRSEAYKQGPEPIERWVSWTLPTLIPALPGSQSPDGPSGSDTGINMPVWKS